MHVVATAGHVDHGKSTLVDALTGMTSDRLAEERRRGLSIELGYTWTTLPAAGEVAFVDVPGHERFVPTMLAGIGPVPVVLLVVAADDPWMPQAAEHLEALDALGVRRGVVAVSRSDLADPGPAAARAAERLAGTSLAGARVLPVSARTGAGLDALRDELDRLLAAMAPPDPAADVRLWVDRVFSATGSGTVVTGTLPAGRVARGDTLEALNEEGAVRVRVRGLQCLGRDAEAAVGVARVALNLAGTGLERLGRGTPLLTSGAWHGTDLVDVVLHEGADGLRDSHEAPARSGSPGPPTSVRLHVGSAAVPARVRPLDGRVARLSLGRRLPLRVGDVALLRDPGSHRTWGLRVLDPAPPPLRRRGAARARAQDLAPTAARVAAGEPPDTDEEVRRRGLARRDTLLRLGIATPPGPGVVAAGGWLLSAERAETAAAAVATAVEAHRRDRPLDPGLPLTALAQRLDLPDPTLVAAVVRPPLVVREGVVHQPGAEALPPAVEAALSRLAADLADTPFEAPTADRLAELRLDARALAAASRAGRVLRLDGGVVLLPGADERAARALAEGPQPFTASEARRALGTTRRVALPLLQHLDRRGLTRRLPDDRREVVRRG